MRQLKNSELKLFEQLASVPQRSLKKALHSFLKSKYSTVTNTKEYLYAEGDIPIALVAHLDTVFSKAATEIFYDRQKNVMWSPSGLGADDRAGVFAICQIIKSGYRPHVIFTTDEEKGGLGAFALAGQQCPFADLRYMIELDRRGEKDCVFYDCDNSEFTKYIEKFGFEENWGTFSDISYLGPDWGVAAVNLSIGYRDEHSTSEILNVSYMLNTIEKVKKMLSEEDIPQFEYVENLYKYAWLDYYYANNKYGLTGDTVCNGCKHAYAEEDTYPVEIDEGIKVPYCMNCIASAKIKWCEFCGSPYVPDAGQSPHTCRSCENRYSNYEEGAV